MDELALRQLNGGEDEDEALRRALALSMGEADEAPEASGKFFCDLNLMRRQRRYRRGCKQNKKGSG